MADKNYDNIAKMYGGKSDDFDHIAKQFGAQVIEAEQAQSHDQMTHQEPVKPDFGYVRNIPMGAIAGATDIGSTLLSPIDYAMGYDRKKDLRQFYDENANPDSLSFNAGRLGTQIAGTAGVGQLLGRGAQAIGAAPKLVEALQSGGFRLGGVPATSLAGRAGDAALRIGSGAAIGGMSAGMIDPESYKTGALLGAVMPYGVQAAGLAGQGARNIAAHVLGSTTGTGDASISAAYQAGKAGDQAFVNHMRGNAEFADVVQQAKKGLENMRVDRANSYRSGMADIKNDNTVLDMNPVLQDVQNIQQLGFYKGQPIQKNASGVVDEITQKVNDWAALNPADYHTPEGLDALKRSIGDIRDSTQFGTPGRKAADSAYNAVKRQIESQAPTYSAIMKDYSQASELLGEITKTLSLGDKAAKDTAVRKLQSLMRNNAQTNYGNRVNIAKELEDKGGVSLIPSLAGQTMNTWTPRGMTGAITKSAYPFAAGGAAMTNPLAIAGLVAGAPLFSPRAMGEALYGIGSAERGVKSVLDPATSFMRQAGGGLLGPAQLDPMTLMRTIPLAISASQANQR
jgi:hypothetical protein